MAARSNVGVPGRRGGDDRTGVGRRRSGRQVLNHLYVPLQVPSLLELTTRDDRGAGALGAHRRPVLKFWARNGEPSRLPVGRPHRDGPLHHHPRRNGRATRPTDLRLGHAFVRSLRAQIAGDVDLAEQCASEALQIAPTAPADAAIIFGAQLMIVCGQRGTMSDLAPSSSKWRRRRPTSRGAVHLPARQGARRGRDLEGRSPLGEFAPPASSYPRTSVDDRMVDFADAAIECGEPSYAAPLFERLEPGGQLPSPAHRHWVRSATTRGLATVLGRLDEADAYFAHAAAMTRHGAKFFAPGPTCCGQDAHRSQRGWRRGER